MNDLKLGCHLSVAKGFAAMAREAHSIDATALAFFTRNPRGGKAKAIDPEDVARFTELSREYGIEGVVAHAAYTMNPAAARDDLRAFALDCMIDDMLRMAHFPHRLYNFHPGTHVGQGIDVGIELIVDVLNKVIPAQDSTTILLETMAGKGSEVGSRFEELAAIIDGVDDSSGLGVCLDTCHVWDAGYDIVDDLNGVLAHFDEVVGLDRLKAIHLNDSLNACGAHKDRHAGIGKGAIGFDALSAVTRHPRLKDLPFILETPNDLPGYADEIARLRSV